ncbi:MAG: ATP-binding protein [Vicinamibacterales bacterium]|nr:ATP-binding protein [Vicinamibacterales bacterium]
MSSRLSIVLANDPSEIVRLVELVEAFTLEKGVASDAAYAMTLSLDEMAANSIRHAYGAGAARQVWVELTIGALGLVATVTDEGPPFNPLEADAPNLDLPILDRPIGGLGIHIVMTMMDEVSYARVDDRNVVTLRKALP